MPGRPATRGRGIIVSRSRLRIPEPLRALHRAAKRADWHVTRTGSGHLRWAPPDGQPIIITSSTPNGGKRGIRNSRAQLRKAGLDEEAS